MKEILLTQGKVALVDDEDYFELNRYKWCAHKNNNVYYAERVVNKHTILMHRIIMNTPVGYDTDHMDGDGLNNQRNNLRIVTHRVNGQNLHITQTSNYPGVSLHSMSNKWRARLRINGKEIHLGLFLTEKSAYDAYCKACEELDGRTEIIF